ncbi:MAG: hypothetical protein NZM40_06535 [Sphingomonadaceae bacterium]|uniref:hypothetical protein n=1 Tax=Thermaurantiacus sp. TaxID=2820283 RepID=UPI00298EF3EB|nr:hypothetical protein [Thermaurantiacus sp.]MCS6987075.1 hypothetical protein [Sphingomonadaceae bacterium]MDW8415587.1 hypothetical protein [Thermaurantiacus sp.]
MLALAVAVLPWFAPDTEDALRWTAAALGAAVVAYVARRSHDLATHARELRRQSERLAARGVPLAAWHAGARLPPWRERTPA